MKAGTYHVVDANRIKALQDAIDAIRGLRVETPCPQKPDAKPMPKPAVDPVPAPPVDVKPMETRIDRLERNIDVILSAIESLQKAELQRQKAPALAPKQSMNEPSEADYEWARARLALEASQAREWELKNRR